MHPGLVAAGLAWRTMHVAKAFASCAVMLDVGQHRFRAADIPGGDRLGLVLVGGLSSLESVPSMEFVPYLSAPARSGYSQVQEVNKGATGGERHPGPPATSQQQEAGAPPGPAALRDWVLTIVGASCSFPTVPLLRRAGYLSPQEDYGRGEVRVGDRGRDTGNLGFGRKMGVGVGRQGAWRPARVCWGRCGTMTVGTRGLVTSPVRVHKSWWLHSGQVSSPSSWDAALKTPAIYGLLRTLSLLAHPGGTGLSRRAQFSVTSIERLGRGGGLAVEGAGEWENGRRGTAGRVPHPEESDEDPALQKV
jgi:hypothetical protein